MVVTLALCLLTPAAPEPWPPAHPVMGAAYFYWYWWDREAEVGNWTADGVYNTPLDGYYHSADYQDNLRSMRQAADWGVNTLFMDYWGPGWQDLSGGPRELLLARAAEQLRREGYPLRISLYQDATDFAMDDFSRNTEDGRHLDWWLRNVAAATDALFAPDGKPFAMVYGRNGAPSPPTDPAGFGRFLADRYGAVAALNAAWGASFASFDEARPGEAGGLARADSLDYWYATWGRSWAELQRAAAERYGLPGIEVSFDTGFTPFLGGPISRFTDLFGGPHSYAGVDHPDDFDSERYLQHAAARWAGRLSFDHDKCYYHDWAIRTPGGSWSAEPLRFDRSFVGMLTRRAGATLHMSWNEWWEGSNLEPSEEFGKGPCETHLFYATLMHAFPPAPPLDQPAPLAYLANEWPLAVTTPDRDELFGGLERLRRIGLPFETVPGSRIATADLARYSALVAPGGGAGLGRDAETARRLLDWVRAGGTAAVSNAPDVAALLGLEVAAGASVPAPQPSNAWCDVGSEGDAAAVLGGAGAPETWSGLPAEAQPAREGPGFTVRWLPGAGRSSLLTLAAAPGAAQVLRLGGACIWPQQVQVSLDGRPVGAIALRAGYAGYELPIPAELAPRSSRTVIALAFEKALVPMEIDPARYPTENRVCNLALDWIQLATEGVTAEPPTATAPSPPPHEALADPRPPARVLDRYADGVWRVARLPLGAGTIVYLNGSLAERTSHWGGRDDELLAWLGPAVRAPQPRVYGPDLTGVVLTCGATSLVPVYNHAPGESRRVRVEIPADGATPVSVRALRRDREAARPVPLRLEGGTLRFEDELRYCAVYEVQHGPVAVEAPEAEIVAGGVREWPLRLRNRSGLPVTVEVGLAAVTPTLEAETLRAVRIPAGGEERVVLTLRARPDADWGRKTVVLRVGASQWIETVTVRQPPELELVEPVVAAGGAMRLRVRPNELLAPAPAETLTASVGAGDHRRGRLAPGDEWEIALPTEEAPAGEPGDTFREREVHVAYAAGGLALEQTLRVAVAHEPVSAVPPGAVAKVVAYNPSDATVAGRYVTTPLPPGLGHPHELCVRDAASAVVPALLEAEENGGLRLHALVDIPAQYGRCLYACRGVEPAPATGLRVEASDLGSGAGSVRVQTTAYAVTLREREGGCATELRSLASGRDYAAGTFGAAHGRFMVDPADGWMPGDGATIVDRMTRQRNGTGRIAIEAGGPGAVLLRLRVEWQSTALRAVQRYTFVAGQPWFLVSSRVEPRGEEAGPEVTVLDFRLARNGLAKIHPNGTGIAAEFEHPRPHFGWRWAPRLPEFVTLEERPDPACAEAWSLGILDAPGLAGLRAGFWPRTRPLPGPCAYGEVELVGATRGEAVPLEAVCVVALHAGHHPAGRALVRTVAHPDLVTAARLE